MSLLEKLIKDASQKYYSEGTSDLTDDQFDAALNELKRENPESTLLTDVGHGYDVSKNTSGEKYAHKYTFIGSLPKCREWNEIRPEFKATTIDVSLKLDGLSVVMYYEQGQLIRAITRGNGEIGIDITDKVRVILKNKTTMSVRFTGAIRGEIIMSYRDFDSFKQLHPEAKFPRNSAAGLIGMKEVCEDLKFLQIVPYTVVGYEPDGDTQLIVSDISSIRSFIAGQFDKVVPYTQLQLHSEALKEMLNSTYDDLKSDYPADGLVFTVCNVNYNDETHAVTYDSQAFKFQSDIAIAKVIDVEWNLTKTRYLVPKVHIEPVQLAGAEVQYCTGYHAHYIQSEGIGPGALVEVERRGEVIPNINQVMSSSTECSLPTHCPECHQPLKWSGVHLMCDNVACTNATLQDALIWIEDIAPVEGLKDKLKLKLFKERYGVDPENLTIDWLMSEGHVIGNETSGHIGLFNDMLRKLYDTNHKIPLDRAIHALNIPRFGDITCTKFASNPDLVQRLFADCMNGSQLTSFSEVESFIGSANADSLYMNIDKFKRLKYIFHRIEWSQPKPDNVQYVAVTGKLSVKRNEFEKELLKYGYVIKDICKETKFLITDDPNSGSSKNQKADKLGIKKLTEHEFRESFLR